VITAFGGLGANPAMLDGTEPANAIRRPGE
jgi:hypothetical protein